jgi:hypothetical protein
VHETQSSEREASVRSRHESRWRATPAASAGDYFNPNIPTTIGATLALGGAGGDGVLRYAARRRKLACRSPAQPLSTAQTKACRTTAPNQPADPSGHRERTTRRFTQIPRSCTASIRHDPHGT